MKGKTIRQSITFKATPHEIYEMLMDSKKHSKFTESGAIISRKVGGKVSAYDGYIEGTNIELVPDKIIVQKWRANDWPDNHYSIVTFELKKTNDVTKLMFTQKHVPEDYYASIRNGWVEHYWDKIKKMLEKEV